MLSEQTCFGPVQRTVKVLAESQFKLAAIHTHLWNLVSTPFKFRAGGVKAGLFVIILWFARLLIGCSPTAGADRSTGGSVSVHLHSSQNLRQLDSSAIYAALHRAFGYSQEIDDLLIGQFLDVPKNDAFTQVRGQPVYCGKHL